MFLRVWVLGHEILSVHFTILDPTFETETEPQPTYEDVEEPAGLNWSADPDDGSHLIWHPEASDAEG